MLQNYSICHKNASRVHHTSIHLKQIFFLKRGADGLFGGKEGRGALFLTGVENTGIIFQIL
jgi:hypothetical protein